MEYQMDELDQGWKPEKLCVWVLESEINSKKSQRGREGPQEQQPLSSSPPLHSVHRMYYTLSSDVTYKNAVYVKC